MRLQITFENGTSAWTRSDTPLQKYFKIDSTVQYNLLSSSAQLESYFRETVLKNHNNWL